MIMPSRLSTPERPFDLTITQYKSIITFAKNEGYETNTVRQYFQAGCPQKGVLILRHDLDLKPSSLWPMLIAERECGARSTIYVRVTANEYNAFCYHVLDGLLTAERDGFEIGLHTNCVEFALINSLDPMFVFTRELNMLRQFFTIAGVAPHRDFNYIRNTLPWIRENMSALTSSDQCCLEYEAYDKKIEDNTIYVNDSFAPHLCWKTTPYDALKTGKSVYFSTHPHWWYVNHPHES